MKRIGKIGVNSPNMSSEAYGYLVVTPDHGIVFDGNIGIRYSGDRFSSKLKELAKEHGMFAIPKVVQFLQRMTILDDVQSIKLDKERQALVITYMAGQAIAEIPIVTTVSEDLPHLNIKWREYQKEKSEGVLKCTPEFIEVHNILTNEGRGIYGDAIGLYGRDGYLTSFDAGVFITTSSKRETPNFFLSKKVLSLGFADMEYVEAGENGETYVVGPTAQYYCAPYLDDMAIKETSKLKDCFDKSKQTKVTLKTNDNTWNRVKQFSGDHVTMQIKSGKIILKQHPWREIIGTVDVPDSLFYIFASVIERWASYGIPGTHALSLDDNGVMYLFTKTLGGFEYYGVLRDPNGVRSQPVSKEPEATESSASEAIQEDTVRDDPLSTLDNLL